jgi:dihydroneopterin aldolase
MGKSRQTGLIEIENMEFYAFHGCYEAEKQVGGRFLVTVAVEADLAEAAASDDVRRTIDYSEVYRLTAAEMAIPSDILEHVAGRILGALYRRFPELLRATVKVSKMQPPLGGPVEKTSVTLTR